jgi:glycosyltransferase involved in cell wall biosynthesis
MRLLLVSQYFWPETFGINALVHALRRCDIETTVLTGKPNYPDGKIFAGYSASGTQCERHEGVEILRLPLYPRGQGSSLRLMLNYLSFVVSGLVLGPWLLRRRQFDAIFVYAPSPLLQALPAVWIAWLKRVPVALWVQDLWPESLSATGFIRNRAVLKVVEYAVRFIYRHADLILIPSEAFRAPVEKLADDPRKIKYCPNAYVDEPESKALLPEAHQVAKDIASGFSVVFAGNLGAAQSLDTIVAAAERLQIAGAGIRFFLIGSGSQSDWVRGEVGRRGLRNVVLPGRFPPEAMPRFYGAASVLLVSLRDEPIFAYTIPSKVQGYMAAGRPVVASLNGEGARVVVAAGAGLACPAGNAEALADSMEKLFRLSADERAEMGENARRYALEHFSLDRLAAELADELRGLSAAYREKYR